MESFIEYLNELESSVAFLTEIWLTDSDHLDADIEGLENRTNYSLICRNRRANARGYSTGGVAIAFKKSHINFKKIDLVGNVYEIIFAVGTMPRFSRKFISVCVYMPPSMSASTVAGCFEFLVDGILEMKRQYKDPFIAVSGDFNNFDIAGALDD